MIDSIITLLNKLYLWQISAVISVFSLGFGFTGKGLLTGMEIQPGMENVAIGVGIFFFILACILRFIPVPPKKEDKEDG